MNHLDTIEVKANDDETIQKGSINANRHETIWNRVKLPVNANWEETIWNGSIDFMAAHTPRTLMSAANTPRHLIRTSDELIESEFHESIECPNELRVEKQGTEAKPPVDDHLLHHYANRRVLEVCTDLSAEVSAQNESAEAESQQNIR